MKICHVCGFECEDDAELCPKCGADLTIISADEQQEEIILNNPVLLASIDDVVSSEIIKDILKDNGIPFTSGEPDSENTLKVMFGGNFIADDIYVDEKDFDKANSLYENFLNEETTFDESFFEDEYIDSEDDLKDE